MRIVTPCYRGRFAPSPTGPLHFGSLVAAVASHADARSQHGEWLVRIEDVDQSRARPDAERQILEALHAFGMHSDSPPVRQSDRVTLYDAALHSLAQRELAYRCSCGRRRIAELGRPGREGPIYPGTCRVTPPAPYINSAWRVIVDGEPIAFEDRVLGPIVQDLIAEIGDFVVRRLDGYTAYQLAVVVDDEAQGITHVVRGADLLWSTPRQIRLQRLLGYRTPNYAHIPLVYGTDGHKLSKRDNAHPADPGQPMNGLRAAWLHLGQADPPAEIRDVDAFWRWATRHWDIHRVPREQGPLNEPPDSL